MSLTSQLHHWDAKASGRHIDVQQMYERQQIGPSSRAAIALHHTYAMYTVTTRWYIRAETQ